MMWGITETSVDVTNGGALCRVDIEACCQKRSNLSRALLWDPVGPGPRSQHPRQYQVDLVDQA